MNIHENVSNDCNHHGKTLNINQATYKKIVFISNCNSKKRLK